MNILKYELKSNIRSIVIWTITIIAILFSFMKGVYPIFENNLESLLKMLEGFPKGFSKALGFDFVSILSFEGFYTFYYTYISLLGGIMAVVLTLAIFSKEKKSKCMDFLFTKPISRRGIFVQKLIAVIIGIIFVNVFYVISTLICFNGNSKESVIVIVKAALGLFLTQLVFVSIGILISVFSKKIRSVSGIGTMVGFGAYILSAVANIVDDRWLDLIAPLKYFDPAMVFNEGNYELLNSSIAVLIIIIGIALSFNIYSKKDIHAV